MSNFDEKDDGENSSKVHLKPSRHSVPSTNASDLGVHTHVHIVKSGRRASVTYLVISPGCLLGYKVSSIGKKTVSEVVRNLIYS